MPHNFDFSKLENVKTIEVNPEGWVTPLYIEYGIAINLEISGTLDYYWKVKGTQHTFTIPVIRMDYLSAGDYKKLFENVLEIFREDYISWKNEGFVTQWSNEYREQYSRFIII
jgi:hypothetical protein